MLDTDAATDATLDRLRRALATARVTFATRTSIDQGLLRARRTLTRLRRSVFSDHEESVREVEPLYRQLRRDTRLSRGASRALETLRADGWSALPVDTWLALPKRERSPRFSDTAIEAFLHGMRGYTPARPQPIPDGDDSAAPARIDREDLVQRLRDHAPVDDVLAWLTHHYGDQGAAQVLRAYGWIHGGELGVVHQPDQRARDYVLPEVVLHARPLTLTEAL